MPRWQNLANALDLSWFPVSDVEDGLTLIKDDGQGGGPKEIQCSSER